MSGDLFGVLLTVVLLGANAFFVASEFALISARRDRLEALVEGGDRRALTVIRAGENLSLMLAGAQLGITLCSILLGRVGEPAVAHLLEYPADLLGVPDALLHTVSFVIALSVVVTLHVLLGEMVPKNIAIAGPEPTAMLLIPVYLVWMRLARPFIAAYNWMANISLRLVGVRVRDELEVAVSSVQLSDMIAESVSEGLLDSEEYTRLQRALQIRNRTVADIAVPLAAIRAVHCTDGGGGPAVAEIEAALHATGYSRFPVADREGVFTGYVHIKDVLPFVADDADPDLDLDRDGDGGNGGDGVHERARARHDGPVVDADRVRPLSKVAASMPLPDALAQLRRDNSHLALVTAADTGEVTAMVALEDLVEDLVGTVRDGTHRV